MNTPRVEFRKRAFDSAVNIAAAKALLAEGMTDGQVAERIGASRTAVAKMRKREGVPTRYRPVMSAKRSRDDRKVGVGVRRAQRAIPEPPPKDTRPQHLEAWMPLAGSPPVSLLDLEPGQCKWPIGEGKPYLFCGVAADGSYCEHHARMSVGPGTGSERSAHRARERVRA